MAQRFVRYVTSDGRPYWHDTVTNQTQWVPPQQVFPAPGYQPQPQPQPAGAPYFGGNVYGPAPGGFPGTSRPLPAPTVGPMRPPAAAAPAAGGAVQSYYNQMQQQQQQAQARAAGDPMADAIRRAKEMAARQAGVAQAQARQRAVGGGGGGGGSWVQAVGSRVGPQPAATAAAAAPVAGGRAASTSGPITARDYPPALVAYVTRVFASPQAARHPREIRAQLQRNIEAVVQRGQLTTHNWVAEPLIELPASFLEQAAAAAAGGSAGDDPLMQLSGKKRRKVLLQQQKQQQNKQQQQQQRKKLKLAMSSAPETAEERRRRQIRLARFGADEQKTQQHSTTQGRGGRNGWGSGGPASDSEDEDDFDFAKLKIVGVCQKLEKSYFRLGGLPLPEEVRPQAVLEKSLAMVLERWATDGNYDYVCDQLKSMRQDLTVQHIRNAFAIRVYEEHARICLEVGDFSEFNQCQTQLWYFYHWPTPPPGDPEAVGFGSPEERLARLDEFTAYRLIYFTLMEDKLAYLDTHRQFTEQQRQRPATAHALAICHALRFNHYHKLFTLIAEAPNHGQIMLSHGLGQARLQALDTICRAYRPTRVPMEWVCRQLGFLQVSSASASSSLSSASSSLSPSTAALSPEAQMELELQQLQQSAKYQALNKKQQRNLLKNFTKQLRQQLQGKQEVRRSTPSSGAPSRLRQAIDSWSPHAGEALSMCEQWVQACGAELSEDQCWLETKNSVGLELPSEQPEEEQVVGVSRGVTHSLIS